MIYKEDEVLQSTLEYFKGDELAAKVWMSKYALVNREGEYLEQNPVDMFRRITKEILRVENTYSNALSMEEIYDLFINRKFILAGSNLFGIGNDFTYSSLGNCFVIPSAEDSYAGILQADAEQVQIMKRRGGVGHDLSLLRPKDAKVNNAAKSSTGPVSFMNRFSESTKEAAQSGRRGALMLTMDITHQDIIDFIKAKDDITKITGANISVRVSDEFIEALVDGDETATDIWNTLVYQAWKNGEPGVLFWDRILEESPADCYDDYKTISTNPCGELPLCAYDSCRLGSIILPSFVNQPFTSEASFNWDEFQKVVYNAQRVMDDVVDLEAEKISKLLIKISKEVDRINDIEYNLWKNIKSTLQNGRRTGLGFLGLADALAMLNISYDSEKAISLSRDIASMMAQVSYASSIKMAQERGAFHDYSYNKEKDNPFIKRILASNPTLLADYKKYGRRNIANLTIAPTGSISMISQYSSGIEPVFNLSYTRRRKVDENSPNKMYKDDDGIWWEEYEVIHPMFKKWMELSGSDDVSLSPYGGNTANEINPFRKVDLQSKIQKWIDHSISATYNLPENITPKEVGELMLYSWESGCKGMTVYRENSRHGILINKNPFPQYEGAKRPRIVECDIFMPTVKGVKYVVLVGKIDNKPYEVFAFEHDSLKIKEGYIKKIRRGRYDLLDSNKNVCKEDITSVMSQAEEDRTRLISTALRHGTPIQYIVEQLYKSKSEITSFSKAIARTLNRYAKEIRLGDDICPQCKSKMVMEGGCNVCLQCGYSKCL